MVTGDLHSFKAEQVRLGNHYTGYDYEQTDFNLYRRVNKIICRFDFKGTQITLFENNEVETMGELYKDVESAIMVVSEVKSSN